MNLIKNYIFIENSLKSQSYFLKLPLPVEKNLNLLKLWSGIGILGGGKFPHHRDARKNSLISTRVLCNPQPFEGWSISQHDKEDDDG